MYIRKMLLLAGTALAVVACSVPAAAQAQTHGLTENGSFVGVNAGVTLTSTNLTMTTGLGQTTCGLVTFHYTVETNTDEHVSLNPVDIVDPVPVGTTPTTNGTATNCVLHTTGGSTHIVHTTAIGTDTLTFDTWGRATVALRIRKTITFSGGGSITCTFSGNVSMQTINGSSNVLIGATAGTLAGGLCGHGTTHGTATLETSNGTALTADISTTS